MKNRYYVMNTNALFLTGYSIESEPTYLSGARHALGRVHTETKAELMHRGTVVNAASYEDAAEQLAPAGDFPAYNVIVVGREGSQLIRVEPSKRARGRML